MKFIAEESPYIRQEIYRSRRTNPPKGGRSGGSADNCWENAHGFNQENGDRSIVIYYYNTQKVYEISAFVQVFSHVCLGS